MNIEKFSRRAYLIILLISLLLLSGCPNTNDKLYPITEEQYLLGWTLHNIDDDTPRQISYSMKDLAVYNYSFNYPAASSHVYDNVMFWIAPFQFVAATSWVRFAVPQSRVYYLKGDPVSQSYSPGWSFYNWMQINYLTSDDYLAQFVYDVAHSEGYLSESPFYGINPVPGTKEQIYFGTAPFTPTSVIVNDGIIRLNDRLLKGYNGKSYLLRSTQSSATSCSSGGCETKILRLPAPTYKIYLNDDLIIIGNLTGFYGNWDSNSLNYPFTENGKYRVEIEIPSGYPIFNITRISASFAKKGESTAQYQMPVLKHIEFPPRFKLNEPLPISLLFENQDAIQSISMFYKTNIMEDWSQIDAGTALVISQASEHEIDFRFDVMTVDGTASYEIYPISLRAIDVSCQHEISNQIGIKTFVQGQCLDENNSSIKGLRLELYSGALYLGAVITDYSGFYTFEADGDVDNVNAVFKGTGIYNPQT